MRMAVIALVGIVVVLAAVMYFVVGPGPPPKSWLREQMQVRIDRTEKTLARFESQVDTIDTFLKSATPMDTEYVRLLKRSNGPDAVSDLAGLKKRAVSQRVDLQRTVERLADDVRYLKREQEDLNQ